MRKASGGGKWNILLRKGAAVLLLLSYLIPSAAFAQISQPSKESVAKTATPTSLKSTPSLDSGSLTPQTPLVKSQIDQSTQTKGTTKSESQAASAPSPKQIQTSLTDTPLPPPPPIGGPSIKGLPQADQSTGALIHDYPIVTPPGRNGVQPDLHLIYNNQTADTMTQVGYGWSLNIPYIQRINKTGVDNLYTSTYFTSSISGELATTSIATSTFKAKVDTGDFMSYTFDGTVWIAVDKNGTTYKFSTTSASRVDDPTNSTHIYRWMLEEVRDTNNNYIKYQYTKTNGVVYPSKIIYTGNGTTDGSLEVSFTRQARLDHATSTVTGFALATGDAISTITIKNNSTTLRYYTLGYSPSVTNGRTMLTSVTETGRDSTGTVTSLPPTQFNYSLPYAGGWSLLNIGTNNFYLNNYRIFSVFDVNGDGHADVLQSDERFDGSGTFYLSSGTSTSWAPVSTSTWSVPSTFRSEQAGNVGYAIADFNGDGYPDLLNDQEYSGASAGGVNVYLNNKTNGWVSSPAYAPPSSVKYVTSPSLAGFVATDVNGDGLADIVGTFNNTGNVSDSFNQVFINNGPRGWSTGTWTLPSSVHLYISGSNPTPLSIVADINGDGLPDILTQYGSPGQMYVYINNGVNGWTQDPNWTVPGIANNDLGSSIIDVNGDGLPDLVQRNTGYANGYASGVYLQKSDGAGWSSSPDSRFNIPYDIGFNGSGMTVFSDITGDGLPDILNINTTGTALLGNFSYVVPKPDLLTQVTYPLGGKSNIGYKSTTAYIKGTALANPLTEYGLDTVSEICTSDGINFPATTTYAYEGGKFYYANTLDRLFAGFSAITATNSFGNVLKNYFHQGDSSDSTHGEYLDARDKIGKVYRNEQYDASGNLYQSTINKWDSTNLGDSRTFVKLAQSVQSTYDGNASHRDSAQVYSYDPASGNQTQQINWGEVNAADDGSFTDIGTDKAITNITYATSSGGTMFKPSTFGIFDQSGSKVMEERHYYDGLSLGSLTTGNETKTENWITGTTYASTTHTFNGYGLVTQSKSPRVETTSYIYDTANLYPATTTDPNGYQTYRTYDYNTGKVVTKTDPNGLLFETDYDGFGRPLYEKQPDITTPSTQVVKNSYTYNDASGGGSILKTNYLDAVNYFTQYTYLDGLGRKIQTRKETEDNNAFATKDYAYVDPGLLQKESLPYLSTGASKTNPSNTSAFFTTYVYDPLKRLTGLGNAVGSTTIQYDQWTATTTDANGHAKALTYDSNKNLVQVVEKNGSSYYATNYQYDPAAHLTKLTDANGNIRNFTYDGLGSQLTAQDLHAIGDGTFGTYTYTYDLSGNKIGQVDPKSQTIAWTYDLLERPLTEDYTGDAGGANVTYGYDSCAYGKTRLCSATTSISSVQLSYNSLGQVANESKNIDTSTFNTSKIYDRQANVTSIVYPDSSQVRYSYNNAGLLESIDQKEPGGSFVSVVSNFNYGPTEQVIFKKFANGVQTTYTYDPTQLYRLTHVRTIAIPSGGLSSQLRIGGSLLEGGTATTSIATSTLSIATDLNPFAGELFTATTSTDTNNESSLTGLLDTIINSSLDTPAASTSTISDSTTATPSINTSTTTSFIPEIINTISSPSDAGTSATSTARLQATTTPQLLTGTTTSSLKIDHLLTLSPDAPELAFKAPIDKHLGKVEYPNGLVKYAYQTNVQVDSVPASNQTKQTAAHAGLELGGELLGKRTTNARTFATNNPNEYLTEIVSGDPQYYKDGNGAWWIADYGFTTKAAYDLQEQTQTKKNIIDTIVSFLIPKIALASSSTFYPGSNAADGEDYKDNSTSWSTVHDATISNWGSSSNSGISVVDQLGNGNGSNYYGIRRSFLLFDTSSLPDSSTIGTASINLFTTSVDQPGSEGRIYIASSSPASNTTIVFDDFDQVGNTSFGISDNTYTINAYKSIPLNDAGKAAISKTGISKFSVRTYNDFNNIPSTSSSELYYNFYASEQFGTSQDPKLVVLFSNVPTAPTSLLTDGASNPTNIIDATPKFSAIFNDPDTGDVGINYQLQVSTSSAFTNVYWDSTKIAMATTTIGGRIPDVTYAGPTLATSTPYYWRIRLWDDSGVQGDWSTETASFTVAIWFPPNAPTSLLVDGYNNPVNLYDATPRFSAVYSDPDPGDTATSYQVQVATSSSFATSTVWDSGMATLSTTTTQGFPISPVSYTGPALMASSTYYWRVRLWDTHNLQSAWSSATSTFSVVLVASSSTIQDLYYTYDPVGNITSISDMSGTPANRSVNYTYDDLNRMLVASTTASSTVSYSSTFVYNPIGDITSSPLGTYGYAGTGYANPDAATSIASSTLAYDNNGNLTSYTGKGYAWDYMNRLLSTGSGGATTTYGYDYAGQRAKKVTSGALGITTYFPNDYYSIGSATTTRQIYDTSGGLIATMQGNGHATTTQYAHLDHLGSVNEVTNATGSLVETLDYYPYGSQRVSIGSFTDQRNFISQVYDPESSLSYLNARYYDGGRGQFLSQDPVFWGEQNLTDPQNLNSYSYANNNPIVNKDPSGKSIYDQLNWANNQTGGQLAGMVQSELTGYGMAVRTALSLAPDSGDAIAAQEAYSGTDYVTGERMGPGERALAGFSVLPVLGTAGDAGRAIRAGDRVAGLGVTTHAAEGFAKRSMNPQQVSTALKEGVKYLDTRTNNLLHIVGEKGKGGYTVVTDQAQKSLVSVQNFVRNLTPKSSPDRFKKLD